MANFTDTYLNPDAMLKRINSMRDQANVVYKKIESTEAVMEKLKSGFGGNSAMELQKKYNGLASTFNDLSNYLQEKANFMETLTTNIQKTDQE